MKKINKLWLVVAVLVTTILALNIPRTEIVNIEEVEAKNKINYEAELDYWLDRLKQQESGGVEHIKHLDSNNKYSFGCYQFQVETFVSYTKRYNLLPESEDAEIENWIYDCTYQRKLAKEMINDNYDNWKHWRTSTGKVGKPPQKYD